MNRNLSIFIIILCLGVFLGGTMLTESATVNINYNSPSTDQLTVTSRAGSVILPFGDLSISSSNIDESSEPANVTVEVTNLNNSESYEKSYEIDVSNSDPVGVPIAQDAVGPTRLSSSGFQVGQVTTLQYDVTVQHPETGKDYVSDEIDIRVLSDPNSCRDILSNNEDPPNKKYIIDSGGSDVEVYCIFEPSGSLVADSYTMKYVENGKSTNLRTDDNTCKDYGMQLFVPRSPEEYSIGRDYVSDTYGKNPSNWQSYGGGLGPLGLYYTDTFVGAEDDLSSSQSAFTGKNVHSYHYGDNTIDEDTKHDGSGWLTFLNTDRFWMAGNSIDSGEPNGDYTPDAWLGFEWDSNGDVTDFNDARDNYEYDSYLCTQKYQNSLN